MSCRDIVDILVMFSRRLFRQLGLSRDDFSVMVSLEHFFLVDFECFDPFTGRGTFSRIACTFGKGLDKQTEGVKISLAKTLVHSFTAFYETDTIDQKTGKPKKVWGAGRKLKFLANIIGAMALPGSFRSKEFIEAFEKEGFSEF